MDSDDEDIPERLETINFYSYLVKKRSSSNDRLLAHQRQALEALCKWFEPSNPNRNKIALVSMPTGSGKTGIMSCLPYFLGYFGLRNIPGTNMVSGHPVYPFNKPSVLVIAPNLEIAKQLKQQLSVSTSGGHEETFLIRRGIVPLKKQGDILPTTIKIESTSELTGEHALQSYDMIIANAQKFLQGNWEEALPDNMFRLVIIDEAHHHPATTWRRIVRKFQGQALVAFFTATPYRGDGKAVLEDTPIAYHLCLHAAVGDGVIRRAEFEEHEEIGSLENFNIRKPEAFTPYDITNMGRWLTILRRVKALLELRNGADRLSQTSNSVAHMAMAIAGDTAQADLLLELWKAICPDDADTAETYHSQKPKYEKQRIMSRLKNNELRLVIMVEMLLEGFDYPPISIAAITYKIGSAVKFVQFVGRAQRVYRGPGSIGENNTAYIVTHKGYRQRRNFDRFQSGKFIPETAEY